MIIDITENPLTPGNLGKDCLCNGEHNDIECCCDECDYLICCIDENCPQNCVACPDVDCPRNGK